MKKTIEFQNNRINHLEARIYELEAVIEIDKSDSRQIKLPEQVNVPKSVLTTIHSKKRLIRKSKSVIPMLCDIVNSPKFDEFKARRQVFF